MNHILAGVTLPGLIWVDEFAWSVTAQKVERSLSGVLLVQAAGKVKGRPITLSGGEDYALVSRATLVALQALADTPGLNMTLTLADARVFSVMFRHEDPPALEASSALLKCAPDDDDLYQISVKLMTV